MKLHLFACAVILAAMPASAQDAVDGITLIHGHPIYHETANEAGVTMGLSVTGDQPSAASLAALCNELRVTAGLHSETREGLKLKALFVVPYKAMVVEGIYLPQDSDPENYALIPGVKVERPVLDGIVARAGLPPRILDEVNVEQEISCQMDEPLWTVAWQDVRPVGDEGPEKVIERARERFIAIYSSVRHRAKQAGRQSTRAGEQLAKHIQ